MAVSLDAIIDNILQSEGGFVNDPDDSGGATNMGITIGDLSTYLGHPATVEEVKDLPEETAREIYRNVYYFTPKINTLPADLQAVVMDNGVNCGTVTAIKMLQNLCIEEGYGPLDADGIIGPVTSAKVQEAYTAMSVKFNNAYVDKRCAYYEAIAVRKPSQKKFLKGWLNRANRFRITDI